MIHGKKGFGRLEWAAKNVLNQSLTWLFYNFNPNSKESLKEGREPISVHQPFVKTIAPTTTRIYDVTAPKLTVGDLPHIYEQDSAAALLEWLHLVGLDASRIHKDDNMDPVLSRYEVPDLGNGVVAQHMARIRWRGFIPPRFVRELFLAIRKEGLRVQKQHQDGEGGTEELGERRWFAITAKGFGEHDAYTVMQWAGRETLCWELLQ
jgi:ribonucleases P/MRP protein subunit RPP40